MSFHQSWIPGLEELGTATTSQSDGETRLGQEYDRRGLPTRGKAAAAVIRSTNAKVAALDEECRIHQQLYKDLSDGVRKYVEAHKEEIEAARQAEREHQEEMQSMVTAMGLLHRELERAAKESRAVGEAAKAAEAEVKLKQEVAEKYQQQLEDERKQRQELEMASIKAARERLSLQDQHRGLEKECASLKQSVAILEEKCRLKEATFVDADNAAAKLQSELLEWRKKALALEAQLKQEMEEKVVAQRLLELERSRKRPRESLPVRKAASASGERSKTPGNKQPPSMLESSLTRPVDARPSVNRALSPVKQMDNGPITTVRSPVARSEGDSAARETAPSTSEEHPSTRDRPGTSSVETTGLSSLVVKQEVEKAVFEALRGAEERCDRAVHAAEARGKQALVQAELERERAVKVATMDLEARLRKEFAAEKTAIAEAAAAEAMEAAVAAAVEEQESLHKQIEQLQAKLRKFTSGVRGAPESVQIVSGSRSHVAAARRQALLKRIPIADEKGVPGTRAEAGLARTVSRLQRSARYGNELPVKQAKVGAKGEAPEKLVVENERLQKAAADVRAALLSPTSVQSDVEPWGSDAENAGRSLRAEKSDTPSSYVGWRGQLKHGVRAVESGRRLETKRVPL